MHEIYLAEKIVKEILKVAVEKKASKVLEARIVIPKNEHFTEKEFEDILKMQAEDTEIKEIKFNVIRKDTCDLYIEDIKIEAS